MGSVMPTGNRIVGGLRFCFRHGLLLVASTVAVVLTMPLEIYVGPEDPAVGVQTYYGLPIPYKVCAPGYAWCQFRWTFVVDVALIYFAIVFIFRIAKHYRRDKAR
jgi:hypothetical protein